MVLCETTSTKACKLCMFRKLILVLSYMAEGEKQYVYFRCWVGLSALVGRIYLIIVSREGDQA